MAESSEIKDSPRWTGLFRRSRDPIFVLNRNRTLLYANPAWESLTGVPLSEARGMGCARTRTGAPLSQIGRVLRPPDEVMAGITAEVRRATPNRAAGPPWWDIDYMPLIGDDGVLAVIGRIHRVGSSQPASKPTTPETWAALRHDVVSKYNWSLWTSNVPAVRRAVAQARLVAQ